MKYYASWLANSSKQTNGMNDENFRDGAEHAACQRTNRSSALFWRDTAARFCSAGDGTFQEVCRSETRHTGNVNHEVRAGPATVWDERPLFRDETENVRALAIRGRPHSDLVRSHVRDLIVGSQSRQRDFVRARREHVSRDECRHHGTSLDR